MPNKKLNLLFLCTGNTCRSVLAEYLARKLGEENNIETSSAGIAANSAFPVPPAIPKLLAEEGVRRLDHTPRLLNAEMADKADYIFAMERYHQDYVFKKFPQARKKTFLLKEFAGNSAGIEDMEIGLEVNDPIGGSEDVYRRCFAEVKKAVQAVIQKLNATTIK